MTDKSYSWQPPKFFVRQNVYVKGKTDFYRIIGLVTTYDEETLEGFHVYELRALNDYHNDKKIITDEKNLKKIERKFPKPDPEDFKPTEWK